MPRFDRTGPMGYGPRTGCGMGPCGCGFGWGAGWGRKFGYGFYGSRLTKKEEKELLIDEAELLKQELKEIEARLKNLKD